jgi:DNA-binding GntR family transcriptional regulator
VFHQQIVELIGSQRLNAFFRRVVAELRLVFAVIDPTEHGRFVPWNRLILDLLLQRKLDECITEMRAYLAAAEEMMQLALERPAGT